MLDCPKCGKPVDGLQCGYCGHSPDGKKRSEANPLHLICHHEAQGQRCAEIGTISPNLRGAGPWYCRKHYDALMGRDGRKGGPPPGGFGNLKASLTPARLDVEAEIERQAIQDSVAL